MTRDNEPLPTPDFAAIEAAARGSSEHRARIFELIGALTCAWSNNESLLVYFIMSLLGTNRESAVVVFGTLNTTRARVDLVQRLAKLNLADRRLASELRGLLARFEGATKVRNDFLHAMYTIDQEGVITHTHAMRIFEKGSRIGYGVATPVDERRLEGLREAIGDLNKLNREMWGFAERLAARTAGRA